MLASSSAGGNGVPAGVDDGEGSSGVGEGDGVGVDDGVSEGDGVGDADGVDVADRVGVGLAVAVAVTAGLETADPEGLGDEIVGVAESSAVSDASELALGTPATEDVATGATPGPGRAAALTSAATTASATAAFMTSSTTINARTSRRRSGIGSLP